MKKTLKVAALITSIAAFGLISGCGDDTSNPSTGKIVKGPVSGATVTFGTIALGGGFTQYSTAGGKSVTTDANGKFTYRGYGRGVQSVGGTYTDVATGLPVAAPTLKAPAGALNVTALTTLVANASTQDAANSLKTGFLKLGVNFDADLSAVSSDAKNRAAINLNELVGNVLKSGANSADITTFATSLATQLATYAGDTTKADSVSTIVTTAGTAASTAAVAAGRTDVFTAVTSAAAVSSYATAVNNITAGSSLTGGTGGTATGTGAGQ